MPIYSNLCKSIFQCGKLLLCQRYIPCSQIFKNALTTLPMGGAIARIRALPEAAGVWAPFEQALRMLT